MYIEVEAYNGSKLLLMVDKIVSVSTHFDTKDTKSYTVVRTVINSKTKSDQEEYYECNETYESIAAKIKKWYEPTIMHVETNENLH